MGSLISRWILDTPAWISSAFPMIGTCFGPEVETVLWLVFSDIASRLLKTRDRQGRVIVGRATKQPVLSPVALLYGKIVDAGKA
jgi:hypothetical protein